MNLFQKYGIKEVMDVIFYTITKIGDEEIYTPALYFDTLKISTVNEKTEKVIVNGAKTNRQLFGWDFGKKISLKFTDCLFTSASLNLIWGGLFNHKLSLYTSIIAKGRIANKYGKNNYSIYAYESPKLTCEEWELLFSILDKNEISSGSGTEQDNIYIPEEGQNEKEYIAENRVYIQKRFYNRPDGIAMPQEYLIAVAEEINSLSDIGEMELGTESTRVIDRWEEFTVDSRNGFEIDSKQQKENIIKYYNDVRTESFIVYFDPKTMLPLFHIINKDNEFNAEETFKIKDGTVCYKWSRTVLPPEETESVLGRELTINTNDFPGVFKIVGDTYAREQRSCKDQRLQIEIPYAHITSNETMNLSADGEPVVFDLEVDVMSPDTEELVKVIQYDVIEDKIEGGTRIIPQKMRYTYTPTDIIDMVMTIENDEIY